MDCINAYELVVRDLLKMKSIYNSGDEAIYAGKLSGGELVIIFISSGTKYGPVVYIWPANTDPDAIDDIITICSGGRFDEEIIPLQTIANLWYEIHWRLNDEKKIEAIDAINEVIAMLESLDRQDEIQDWQDKISEIESDSEDDEEDFDSDEEDESDDEENFEDETEDIDDEQSETSEIDTSESINLLQGQRLNLSSENLSIAFDFENANTPDVFIFLLNDTGKVSGDDDMIFYNNPKNESESIEILEDEIKIDLLKMPNVVKKVVIAIAFDDNKNFDGNESTIHLIDESERKELFNFQFGKSLNTEKAIVVGEIYKHNDKWKFKTVGAGFNGGLAKLCEHFGVEVE